MLILALTLIAVSLVNLLILTAISGTLKLPQRGVRLLLTGLLAFFLIQGAIWARWVTFAITSLSSITSLIVFFSLADERPLFLRVWPLVMGIVYGTIGLLLLFSKRVAHHFNR